VIIVDTSVLVDFFRGEENAQAQTLARLAEEEASFAIPVACCQELLQGARNDKEWNLLHEYLSTQKLISAVDPLASHMAAARIYYDCRRKGITLRGSIDCFIAQLCVENEAALLHNDEDFERIAKVCPLRFWDGR